MLANEADETGDEDVPRYTEEERREITKTNRNRAEELLKEYDLENKQEKKLINRVKQEVSKRKMIKYGKNDVAAGPEIYNSDEIILVEGRADVINLMRMGIDNAIAIEGTNIPANIIHLCNSRIVTALLDGDRGGDMILKELLLKTEIEYVARAPVGKEIEHLDMSDLMDIIENHKKPIMEAEFINENISLIKFLKLNHRYNVYRNKSN